MNSALYFLAPLLAALGGTAMEALGGRRDRRRYPAPGQLVDIGSYRLHARMIGRGEPVIVLEAGAGEWSSHFEPLLAPLAERATVIAYDRAGMGWSEPIPGPRSATSQVQELRELLRRLAPERRYLLVGRSTGARVLRLFAHRYPMETAGLVFLNGYHEDLETQLAQAGIPSPRVGEGTLRMLWLASRLGILRLLGRSPIAPGLSKINHQGATLQTIEDLSRWPRTLQTILEEERCADTDDELLRSTSLPPELPIEVLIAGQTLCAEGTPSSFPRADYNRAWCEVSARLAGAGAQARVSQLADQDDLFALKHPQTVLEAVDRILEGTSSPTPESRRSEASPLA